MRRVTKVMLLIAVLVILLSLLILPTVAATQSVPMVQDNGGIFTNDERVMLEARLREVSEKTGCYVGVITVYNQDTSAAYEVIHSNYQSYSDSCWVLVIWDTIPGESDRYWFDHHVRGDMDRYIDDDGFDLVDKDETLNRYIKKDHDFLQAGLRFADQVELASEHMYRDHWLRVVIISAVIGVIAGGITVLVIVLRYRKKNRTPAYPLKDYTRLHLTREQDIFLGRSVVTVRLSSGGGGRPGGRGGGGGGRVGGGRSGGRR